MGGIHRLYRAHGGFDAHCHTGAMPLVALLAALATLAAQTPVLAPALEAPRESPRDERCRLFGAFVDEAGAPVAGVTLRVSGQPATSVPARRSGIDPGWQNPVPNTTGEDGRCSVSFAPPSAHRFTLTATAPGRGRVVRTWSELAPGQELDLG